MDGFNKVLSFILGLIVVLVFVIVLSNRLHWGNKFLPFQASNTYQSPTPTSTKESPTPTLVFTNPQTNQTKGGTTTMQKQTTKGQTTGRSQANQKTMQNIQTIPSTGSPTELLVLFGSLGALGVYLRKRG